LNHTNPSKINPHTSNFVANPPNASVNATPPILCPLDTRRSPKEIYIKLFIVHFIAIVVLCHLHSIHGEKVLHWKTTYWI
jgi:hypothetical protein